MSAFVDGGKRRAILSALRLGRECKRRKLDALTRLVSRGAAILPEQISSPNHDAASAVVPINEQGLVCIVDIQRHARTEHRRPIYSELSIDGSDGYLIAIS